MVQLQRYQLKVMQDYYNDRNRVVKEQFGRININRREHRRQQTNI